MSTVRSLALVLLLSGCTINLIRTPKEPQLFHEQADFLKWLHQKGFGRSEPELMNQAVRRMFGLKAKDQDLKSETEQPELLERLLLRLEKDIENLSKDRPPAAR